MGADLAVIAAVVGSVLMIGRFVLALVLAAMAARRQADFEIEITPSSAVKVRLTHPVSGAFEEKTLGAGVGASEQTTQGPRHGPATP